MTDIFFGGGLNQNDDLNINIEECFEGQNFKLDAKDRHFTPRRPFDLKGTAPNAGIVSGVMQLIKRDNTSTQLIVSGPTVYRWDGADAFTSMATVVTASRLRGSYWSLDDRLVVTDIDLNNTLQQWDGTTFQKNKHGIGNGTTKSVASITRSGTTATATVTSHGYSNNDLVTIAGATQTDYNDEFIITNVTTDTFDFTVANSPATPATGTITAEKSVDLYAKYSIVFQGRTWLFNVKDVNGATTSLNPHMILASEFENPDVFDTVQTVTDTGLTGNEAFFMLSPDLRPINGVVGFYNTIIISTTDGKLFKLTGTDATDYLIEEYYPGSAATGTESMVNTGNDVIYMRKDGSIDFVGSVTQFGDIKADDISRWIPDEVSGLSGALTVYDQERQKIFFFVTGKVLVLEKEMLSVRPDLSPWSVYKTAHANSFNTTAATYIRDPIDGGYDIYWGDASGNVFKMDGTSGAGDAGTIAIDTKRKTRLITELNLKHKNIMGRAEYRRIDACNLQVLLEFGESFSRSTSNLALKARVDTVAYFGGPYYFGGDVYFNQSENNTVDLVVSTVGFSPPGKGNMMFIETRVNSTADFLVNRLIV